jgi:hypothetical protein
MTAEAPASDSTRGAAPGGRWACFWVLTNAAQMPNPFYVWLLMWMPGCAALLMCRILRRPLSILGWTWNWRYLLIGYLVPIAYCVMASLCIWLSGVGGFPDMDFVHRTAESFGLGGAPTWVVIAVFAGAGVRGRRRRGGSYLPVQARQRETACAAGGLAT